MISSSGHFKATIRKCKDGTYSVTEAMCGSGGYPDINMMCAQGFPDLPAARLHAEKFLIEAEKGDEE